MFALKTVASGLAICFVQQVAQDDASLRIVNVQATSRQLVTRGADVLETCEACAVNETLQQQHEQSQTEITIAARRPRALAQHLRQRSLTRAQGQHPSIADNIAAQIQ